MLAWLLGVGCVCMLTESSGWEVVSNSNSSSKKTSTATGGVQTLAELLIDCPSHCTRPRPSLADPLQDW